MHGHGSSERTGPAAAPATEGRLIRWARWYDPLVVLLSLGTSQGLRRKTVELAGIRLGQRVLDVGCGTGDLTMAAASAAGPQGDVVGIDASEEMIGVARQKAARKGAAVRFEVALIERIPFPEDHFDVVLSSLMLHHLPGRLKQDGLAEVYRVLKPGGRVVAVDMRDEPPAMVRALIAVLAHDGEQQRAGNLRTLFAGAGFDVEALGIMAAGVLNYAVGRKDK